MTGSGHHVNWSPIGLALLLAFLGIWLNHVSGRVEVVDTAGFTHDPDFIVEHLDATAFDKSGMPYQRLVATRMTHYMDDDTTVLDNPTMRTLDQDTPLSITSKRALLSADGQQAYFLNQVHVEQLAKNGKPPITLETEYLHVSADAHTLSTHKPVTLRQGRSQVTANGMFADDRIKVISLDGNVRGVYQHAR